MCTICGLPTTHSNLSTTLAAASLLSFGLTTYLGAKLVLSNARARRFARKIKKYYTR